MQSHCRYEICRNKNLFHYIFHCWNAVGVDTFIALSTVPQRSSSVVTASLDNIITSIKFNFPHPTMHHFALVEPHFSSSCIFTHFEDTLLESRRLLWISWFICWRQKIWPFYYSPLTSHCLYHWPQYRILGGFLWLPLWELFVLPAVP